jgi:hypothetical protein
VVGCLDDDPLNPLLDRVQIALALDRRRTGLHAVPYFRVALTVRQGRRYQTRSKTSPVGIVRDWVTAPDHVSPPTSVPASSDYPRYPIGPMESDFGMTGTNCESLIWLVFQPPAYSPAFSFAAKCWNRLGYPKESGTKGTSQYFQ